MYYDNKCHQCAFKMNVPGNCHIGCTNPSKFIIGDKHGVNEGWFIYPLLFDPVWHTSRCPRFLDKKYEDNNLIESVYTNFYKMDETALSLGIDLFSIKVHDNDKDCMSNCDQKLSETILKTYGIISKNDDNKKQKIELYDYFVEKFNHDNFPISYNVSVTLLAKLKEN